MVDSWITLEILHVHLSVDWNDSVWFSWLIFNSKWWCARSVLDWIFGMAWNGKLVFTYRKIHYSKSVAAACTGLHSKERLSQAQGNTAKRSTWELSAAQPGWAQHSATKNCTNPRTKLDCSTKPSPAPVAKSRTAQPCPAQPIKA